jgi:hypothetical protein
MSSFSLSAAKAVSQREDRGASVALRDEQGEALTVTIDGETMPVIARVAGKLSATYRKAEQAAADKAIKRRSMDVTAEAIERQQLDIIAACVLSWNLYDGDTPIPCTKENVVTVFLAAPWIRRDIEGAMSDPARFLADGAE